MTHSIDDDDDDDDSYEARLFISAVTSLLFRVVRLYHAVLIAYAVVSTKREARERERARQLWKKKSAGYGINFTCREKEREGPYLRARAPITRCVRAKLTPYAHTRERKEEKKRKREGGRGK